MKQRAVEKFYSVAETAFLLGFGPNWVRQEFCDAESPYAERVVKIDKDYRIPASVINEFIDARRLRQPDVESMGVPARSSTEVKRKVRGMEREE